MHMKLVTLHSSTIFLDNVFKRHFVIHFVPALSRLIVLLYNEKGRTEEDSNRRTAHVSTAKKICTLRWLLRTFHDRLKVEQCQYLHTHSIRLGYIQTSSVAEDFGVWSCSDYFFFFLRPTDDGLQRRKALVIPLTLSRVVLFTVCCIIF